MNKKIIIVTGYLAGGKTSFSNKLAEELRLPCFNRDLIKIVLLNSPLISSTNVYEVKQISALVFDLLAYIVEVMMKSGNPVIIESNFVDELNVNNINENDIIKALIQNYNYESLTFFMKGDLHTLHKRFLNRENELEREKIKSNGLFDDYRFFKKRMQKIEKFDYGGIKINIDTTDFNSVNLKEYLLCAKKFL